MNRNGFFDFWTLIKLAVFFFVLFWILYFVQNPTQAWQDLQGMIRHSRTTVNHVVDNAFGQRSGDWWKK